MTAFETVLADIFDRGAEKRIDDLHTERETIAAAQSGDESATLALLYAYAPALRNLVSRHRDRLGEEDARSAAVEGVLVAIAEFDADSYDGRLAGPIRFHIANALQDSTHDTLPVPSRTVREFLAILRKADGDLKAAALLAPSHGMALDTFFAVRDATMTAHLGDTQPDHAVSMYGSARDAYAAVDDRLLADAALEAMDDLDEAVCRWSYGFETGSELSDAEVAQAMSEAELGIDRVAAGESVVSRATVQRRRKAGLAAARESLCVD